MKTTARAALIAALLSLLAGPAFAQCTNMQANTVCGRLGIPAGGGSAQAIPFAPFAAAIAPNFGWIRLNTIQNPATGFGLELGYDGTEGVIQSYSDRSTLTLSPIFYIGASHQFTGGFSVKPSPQTSPNSRVFSISSTENGAVSGAPGPIQLTWGASAGSVWDASPSGGNIGGNANVITMTMFAKQDTFDAVALQAMSHLSLGTGAAIVGGRFQSYIDNTATSPRGGTGLEVLMQNSQTSGDIWGSVIGSAYHATTTTGSLHGTEYDIEATGTTIKGKIGIVIGSTQTDVASITGTLTVNGFADTIPTSAAYWVTAFGGGSASGFNTGILTLQETGSAKPITGRLWYAGGFSVPTGLDWGRMTFSTQAMLLPNNAPIRAYATDNTTIYSLINLNTSNLIALGGGATVDPSSGNGAFGSSTMTALATSGTAGAGYVELGNQSSAPSTPAANKTRLFANTSGAFSLKNANGFVATFATTANTADRGYTFPDAGGTVDLIDAAQIITGAKTFGAAGNVGKLIIAGTTSGTTILNATAVASGTLTLPAATDTLVGKATTDTLTNKTLTSPVIATIVNTGTLTLPTSTDTLVGKATTDTFQNKTYDTASTGNSFRVNSTAITAVTGSGATVALATSPVFVTPTLGAASATSVNFGGDALSNYIASTAWTPADGSGAALTFTNVNAHYTRMGNMVFAYGRVTYPATASGSSAVISGLPVTSANATYATAPCSFYSASGSTNSLNATVAQNATTIGIFKNDGSASTNANLTGATLLFQCIYPAT